MKRLTFVFLLLTLLAVPLASVAQTTSMQELTRDLRDPDPQVRLRALATLGQLGPAAIAAIPALIEAMRDPVQALGQSQRDPADVFVAWRAAETLARIGRDAVPALIRALQHPEPTVRLFAASALGQVQPAEVGTVRALAQALKDSDPAVRESAISALMQTGPAAKDALPALAKALQDADPAVQRAAAEALPVIDPDAAASASGRSSAEVPALLQALTDSRAPTREHAATALGELGSTGKDGIPGLVQALRDPEAMVRRSAAVALGQMEPAAKERSRQEVWKRAQAAAFFSAVL